MSDRTFYIGRDCTLDKCLFPRECTRAQCCEGRVSLANHEAAAPSAPEPERRHEWEYREGAWHCDRCESRRSATAGDPPTFGCAPSEARRTNDHEVQSWCAVADGASVPVEAYRALAADLRAVLARLGRATP